MVKKKPGPKPRDPIKFEKPKLTGGRSTLEKPLKRDQRPLTKARLTKYLKVLAETGSKTAAAHAATPWSKTKAGGCKTFIAEMKRNPEFKEAVEEAYQDFVGRMNQEVVDRAFEPTLRPIVSQGQVIAHEEKYDNQLLMRVAARHQPEKWGNKAELKHTGQINHGVMVVGALAASEEEWEEKYGQDQPELEDGEDDDAIDVDVD